MNQKPQHPPGSVQRWPMKFMGSAARYPSHGLQKGRLAENGTHGFYPPALWRIGNGSQARSAIIQVSACYKKSDRLRFSPPVLRLIAILRKLSKVTFFMIGVVVRLETAHGQPFEQLHAHGPKEVAVLPSPAYCNKYTLTGPEFMSAIKDILDHGDLTDISFIEKTLKTSFTLSYFDTNPDGEPDNQALKYYTGQMLNSPITDVLWIDASRARQLKFDSIAIMSIDSQSLPRSNMNYILDCLGIPMSSVAPFFGGNFLGGVINGRGSVVKDMSVNEKGRSRLYLNVAYDPTSLLVSHIGIAERPIISK